MAEITLTSDNFQTEVLERKGLILVDFWATWCGPCQMIAPVLKEIADQYEGRLTVGKVNVDEQMPLAMAYSVASIPTLLLFKDGKMINKSVGFGGKEELEAMFAAEL